MAAKERVLVRRPQAEISIVEELIQTTQDRILLRGGIFLKEDESFPDALESIVVDVTVALYTRHELEQEGIETEKVDTMSIKVVDDLLAEYDREIGNFAAHQKDTDGATEKVRFI